MAGTDCGSKLDFSKISQSEILADPGNTNRAWIKADIEEKIYFLNSTMGGLLPGVVLKFSDGCFASMCPSDQATYNPTLLLTSQALNATSIVANSTGSNGGSPQSTETTSLQDTSAVRARNVCSLQGDVANSIGTAVDAASINDKGNQPAAVLPAAAIIPMRSNVRAYGPFASNNFHTSAGGIGVEVNPDLAPWVFGSTTYMIEAGNAIAQSANIGLLYGETGGVTVPGLPKYSFGQIFGVSGPNLTGISVTFGSNGATTTYDFRTFTPKFGGLTRQYIDRFKTIVKYRNEQLRFLRNNQITQGKINRQIQRFNNSNRRIGAEENKANSDKASLQRILVGGTDTNSVAGIERSIVGTSSLSKTSVEMMENYAKKAYMSLDAFFTPVSLRGDGGFPGFTSFTKVDLISSSNYANPPIKYNEEDVYNLNIDQWHLNPLTNKIQPGDHHHTGEGHGHAIDLVGRNAQVPENGLITNFYGMNDSDRYSSDYRFLSLKGPLVLQSWGYDTNGKPIPNEASDTDRFANNWLSKPSTWPVGPIDLRFDRNRGVWVSPPPFKIVVAKLETSLVAFGTATASIITTHSENPIRYSEDLYDKDGVPIVASDTESQAKIDIIDKIGGFIPSDSIVYAYYDTYTNKYIALNSASSKGSIFKGYYNGAWNKGATQQVTLANFNTSVSVTNQLEDILPDTSSGGQKICYVINVENNNYELVSAEC